MAYQPQGSGIAAAPLPIRNPGQVAQDPNMTMMPGRTNSGPLGGGGPYNTGIGIPYGGDTMRPFVPLAGNTATGPGGATAPVQDSPLVTPLATPPGWHFWGQHGGVGGHGVNPGQSRRWGTPDTSMRGEAPMGAMPPPATGAGTPPGLSYTPPYNGSNLWGGANPLAAWGGLNPSTAPYFMGGLPQFMPGVLQYIMNQGSNPLYNQNLMNRQTSADSWNPWGTPRYRP